MKKITLLAIFIMAVLSLGFHGTSHAQLLFDENFDYPVGDLLTAHGWTAHSGTVYPLTITPASITYPSYLSSGIGNEVSLVASGEDVNKTFSPQTSGTVYASFIVNISAENTTGDYFFHLGENPWNTYFKCRIYSMTDAGNNLAFGISFTSAGTTPPQYTEFTYSLNTTYFLVVKYTFVDGGDDFVNLFIDPVIGAAEPLPTKTSVGSSSDAVNVGAVALRQGTNSPALKLDGIRVGLTWDDCAGSGTIIAPTIQAADLSFSNVLQTQMDLAWTNGDGAKRIAVINTTNSFTDPVDGTDPVANPVYNGSGEQIIYNSNGNSVSASGLTGGTTYWFRVYEYNGAGTTTKYLTTTANLNPNSHATLTAAVAPIITTPVFADITNSSALLGGDITSDGGSAIIERGTVWNTIPGVTIADNILAEGGTGIGIFSHTRAGLAPKTQIFFKAYATNVVGTSLTDESSFYTLANEPGSHVAGFTATGSSTTSIDLTWSTAVTDADGYLVIQKPGATPPSGIPADATGYTVGSVLGDGTVAALVTPGSSLAQIITGLSPATQYSFTIIPFAWDGTNAQTYNYYIEPVIPGATATTIEPPSTTYTWIGADNAAWTTPESWNPTRSVPANNDVLQFNDGTWKTVSAVPTETILKLVMANNTTVNLQSTAASTITITGGASAILEISAGCNINLNAANPITLALGTGATASISGNVSFENAAHRLTAVDPGAITFHSGATFTAGTSFAGNAFGTTSLGSVIFSNGSTYVHQSGSNPFGAGQPNSVVVFQTGSLFKLIGTATPSFSGRTYANFEMDAAGGSVTPTGGTAVSMDNLTVTNGTLNFNMTGTPGHSIKGNIVVAAGGMLNFTPASAGTVMLNGSGEQTITVLGGFSTSTNSTIDIANSAGIVLNNSVMMDGNLQLTNGLVTLGPNNLLLGAASIISGTPSASAMIVATGTGQLQKGFAAAGIFTFPVGDNTVTAEYSPVTLNFNSGTFNTGNYAGVNLVNAKYPEDPNTANYLNRYWNVMQNGIADLSCNLVFQYVPADVTGAEDQILCVLVNPAPYNSFDPANTTLHELTANWLTSFGTFTGTQLLPPAVTTHAVSEVGDTYATLNGAVNANNLVTNVLFEYGLTTSYGMVAAGVPPTVSGNIMTDISAAISGLDLNTVYHVRIIATNSAGTSYGNDLTFLTGCPVPLPAGTITGPAEVCQNGFGYIYTVPEIQGATFYVWSLPAGADIAFGAGTNQITVNFGSNAASGDISVFGSNGCGNGLASPNFALTVNPEPGAAGTINGPGTVCAGATGVNYQVPVIADATSYNWSVPAGATITSGSTTNSIMVSFGAEPGSGIITVSGTNACGTGATSPLFNVSINALPEAAGTITGYELVCAGAIGVSYQVPVIADATSYTWSVPAGATITSGSTTNNILVTFGTEPGSGIITVFGINSCGSGDVSPNFSVTVNPLPAAAGTITGTSDVCPGTSGVSYEVPVIANAESYSWTVPAGVTITSGSTTNNIVVTFGYTPGPGIINVRGINGCGEGIVSPDFGVTVNPTPETPVVTAAGAVLTSSATTGNQWYNEVTGVIAGETGQTYTVTITGSYYTVVTVNGCISPESNHVNVVIQGQQELENSNFSIYPAPNDGRFTVSITGFMQETFTIVVYNQIGAKICELGDVLVNGTFKKQIDLRPVANGIYSVVFLNSERKVVKKVVVNK